MAVLLIILKILLIIVLVLLGMILLVMAMPIGADISYIDGKFTYRVRASFINIMDSDGKGIVGWIKKLKSKPKKPKKPKPIKEKKPKKKKSVVNDEAYLEDFDFDSDDDIIVPETVGEDAVHADEAVETAVTAVPDKKGKKHRKKKKEEELPADPFEDVEDEPEEEEKRSLGDWVELGMGVWESAQWPLLKIFKAFHFQDLYIDFVISDEDAYDCALKYGKYSGMVYNIIGFLSTVFTVRLKTVDIGCGFGLSKSKWDASCRIFFRAGSMVIAGLWFLITYLTRIFIPGKLRKMKRKKSAARQK